MKHQMNRAVFMPGTMPSFPAGRAVWPFKNMNVGDEVIFDDDVERARAAAFTHAQKSGKRFMTRKSVEGLHVYRIA